MFAIDEAVSPSQDALPVCLCPWLENPYRLVSLLEMEWIAKDFVLTMGRLQGIMCQIETLAASGLINRDELPDTKRAHSFRLEIQKAKDACLLIELDAAEQRLSRIDNWLTDVEQNSFTYERLDDELSTVAQTIQDQLASRKFLYIPTNKARYFEPVEPLGPHGSIAFAKVNKEAIEASTCYAVGRNTASVFHSMRVAELGLHVLAVDVCIPLPRPVDLEGWRGLIDAIEKKIRSLEDALPRGVAKSEKLTMCSQGASQFWYFKEAWRHHVAHARDSYDEAEAFKVLRHVQDFMEYLARGGLHE